MNQNVLFTQKEYEQLKQEFPTDYQERIERLSNYMTAMDKVYPNHLSTIRLWEDRARQKAKEAISSPTPSYSKSFAYAGTAIPDYSKCKGATL